VKFAFVRPEPGQYQTLALQITSDPLTDVFNELRYLLYCWWLDMAKRKSFFVRNVNTHRVTIYGPRLRSLHLRHYCLPARQVNIEIERAAESLDQGHSTRLGRGAGHSRLINQMCLDSPVDDAQYLPHDFGPVGEEKP